MPKPFRPLVLTAALALFATLGGPAAPARAMPAAGPAATAREAPADLLLDVRYVQRCRPVITERVRPNGRVVRVRRDVCRQVWVGPRRDRYRY